MWWKALLGLFVIAWPMAAAAASRGALFAYVDPGAGSFIVQALLAALAGIIVTANLYWKKIKDFFGIDSNDPDDTENPDGRDE